MASVDVTSKTTAEMAFEKTAIKLGFTSPKRSSHIKIRVKKGAAHVSWSNPKSSITDAAVLAEVLIEGFKVKGRAKGIRVPARPIFTNYASIYRDDMVEIIRKTFKSYSHWSVRDRAVQAGKAIIRDLKKKAYNGSLDLVANQGKYAARKLARYGDAPFVATKALLNSLEVVIE